jgi:hypothetical protein
MRTPAPIVDENLAKLFADMPNPSERLARDQGRALLHNILCGSDEFKLDRLVELNCRHFVVTRAVHRANCPRCGEMIRSGYDYDEFRRHDGEDTFSWPDDPLRVLHETD